MKLMLIGIKLVLFFNFLFINNTLKASPTDAIILDFFERPPYFILVKGNNTISDGVVFHIVEKIFKTAKIPYQYEMVPFPRTVLKIKKNDTKICALSVYKNKDREEFSYFTSPIFHDKKTIFVYRKGDERFNNLKVTDDVFIKSDLKYLAKIGFSQGEYLDQMLFKYKQIKPMDNQNPKAIGVVYTSSDINSMFSDILNKKADYMLSGRNEAEFLIQNDNKLKSGLAIKEFKDQPPGEFRYIMCSKNVGIETINKLNEAIKKVVKKY
ncbi:substrate-binding periplasmic protein [Silvanigrella aquatica]|uniref:Uncharacterized protein n=1 Tax=Silvanigrella aquatica TaxID=1915309 RepID=A0A1L4CZS6_9BACT|nr:transporter substrate-binding domain-containing protein [Silvanigrella aquatica]APJ03449.1 hypothetical protein AXG55_05835 [Silvanigrella aquatica]